MAAAGAGRATTPTGTLQAALTQTVRTRRAATRSPGAPIKQGQLMRVLRFRNESLVPLCRQRGEVDMGPVAAHAEDSYVIRRRSLRHVPILRWAPRPHQAHHRHDVNAV